MRLMEGIWLRCKRSRSANLLVNRVKALTGLLSKRARLFLLFNLLFGVVFSAHLAHLCFFSLHQQHYPHLGLILLVMLYLMSTHRQALFARAAYCAWGGIPLVVVGVLCYFLGIHQQPHLSQNDFLALTTLGVVTIWIGGFVTCFGLPGMRVAPFPLGFLLLVIPLPDILLAYVITTLQSASADVTEVLFKLLPLPVVREGFTFALPGLQIEVAPECSGIRSSIALLLTGLLASHLWLRRWWNKAVIWLLIYPLAVFKNGLRIVTLCLLTLYVDEGFITGDLHTGGGAIFFGIALAMLLPVLFVLRKMEAGRVRAGRCNSPMRVSGSA
jgi:exosortase